MMVVIIISLSLLLDRYVARSIDVLIRNWRSERAKRAVRWGFWIVTLGVTISLLLLFSVGDRRSLGGVAYWVFSIFLTFFITKLVWGMVLLFEDLTRLIGGLVRRRASGKFLPDRRRFVSQVGMGLAALPFFSFLYGIVKGKYDYTVHRKTIYFDDLPEAFDGFTITQLSDIHSGSFDNREAVRRGIELANAQQSDLFVFTGDIVNNVAEEIVPWINHFQQLRAPFGQFSILGNHDYGEYVQWDSEADREANMNRLKNHHQELGYRLMLDENVTLEKDGQKISLLGVENWGQGFIQKGDLNKALEGVDPDSFKILLSHDPSHWDEIVRKHPVHVHLTLSGHTHGMQMGIETPTVRWSPVEYRYPHWADLAQDPDTGRYLYVNRGFGFIGFSGRVGIWPEITVLELRRKA